MGMIHLRLKCCSTELCTAESKREVSYIRQGNILLCPKKRNQTNTVDPVYVFRS